MESAPRRGRPTSRPTSRSSRRCTTRGCSSPSSATGGENEKKSFSISGFLLFLSFFCLPLPASLPLSIIPSPSSLSPSSLSIRALHQNKRESFPDRDLFFFSERKNAKEKEKGNTLLLLQERRKEKEHVFSSPTTSSTSRLSREPLLLLLLLFSPVFSLSLSPPFKRRRDRGGGRCSCSAAPGTAACRRKGV